MRMPYRGVRVVLCLGDVILVECAWRSDVFLDVGWGCG